MSAIKNIRAREILDSRGNPTVEVEVFTVSGICACASVPSGASTGEHEALELRDGDMKRFGGKGVLKAVANVENIIAPAIAGMDIGLQQEIDRRMLELDGTPFKENLGANAVLGVSLACARGRAMEMGVPLYRSLAGKNKPVLPVPMLNIFNGGAHSGAKVALQEFMIRPVGAGNFADAVQISWQVINTLKSMLKM